MSLNARTYQLSILIFILSIQLSIRRVPLRDEVEYRLLTQLTTATLCFVESIERIFIIRVSNGTYHLRIKTNVL